MKLLSEFNNFKYEISDFASLPFFTREAHMRTTKSGKRVPVKKSKVKKDRKNLIKNTAIGSGILGLGTLAGLALYNRKAIQTGLMIGGDVTLNQFSKIVKNPLLKRKFQKVIKTNQKNALKNMNKIDIPEGIDSSKDKATFIVGGFAGFGKNSQQEAKGLGLLYRKASKNKNYHSHIPEHLNVNNSLPLSDILSETNNIHKELLKNNPNLSNYQKRKAYINIKKEVTDRLWDSKEMKKHTDSVGNLISDTFIEGKRNKDSEFLLTKILKTKQENPNIKINLIGSSGGGFTTQEVAQHLDELGIDYRHITIGTPDLGVIKQNKKKTVGVIGKEDSLFNKTPIFNKKIVEGGIEHDSKDYFTDSEVKKLFNDFLF